ncbi:MAG TPA: cyclic nucleotide-binding domain-containing protein [Acetobacteraceae bacterium]|nr:cyclic nucleotide-binding domain-containing protein [Acetobacteraceae bacterium]
MSEGLAPTLDAATRRAVWCEATPLQAPAGTVLFRPGDPCRGFLMLRTGRGRVELVAEDGHALLLDSVAPGEACALHVHAVSGCGATLHASR